MTQKVVPVCLWVRQALAATEFFVAAAGASYQLSSTSVDPCTYRNPPVPCAQGRTKSSQLGVPQGAGIQPRAAGCLKGLGRRLLAGEALSGAMGVLTGR